jgi:hypothetical protein
MLSLRKTIFLVTILLFVYNAFFTYIIINLTAGSSRFLFLSLLGLDYIIIFYFIIQIAHEIKFDKKRRKR